MRSWIRKSVPGSATVYEESRLRWKARHTKSLVTKYLQQEAPIRLDVGSGDLSRPGWIGLDITDGCDLFWDLRNGIPFPDNSVDFIYSSHLLEHMSHTDGKKVLDEMFRVLRPEGPISVCVPDARLYVDAYLGVRELAPDHAFWEEALVSRSGIDLLNYIAYMANEHRCLFDQDSLVLRLREAGFSDVHAREFDGSIDLPERRFESIYASGKKSD